MKRFAPLLVVLGLLVAGSARAASGEDLYISIFNTIITADGLQEKGQGRAALEKYMEAEEDLKKLKSAYSTWNTKIVDFRLLYLKEKIGPLKVQYPGTTIPKRVIPPGELDDGRPMKPVGIGKQIDDLNQELINTRTERSTLENKLKEALAARLAENDPEAYKKAQGQILELRREADVGHVTLENQMKELAKLRKDYQTLQSENVRLAARNQEAALRAENGGLKDQISQLNRASVNMVAADEVSRRVGLLAEDLKAEQARVAALVQQNEQLSKAMNNNEGARLAAENVSLKQQVAGLSRIAGQVGSVESATQQLNLSRAELNAQKALNEDLKKQNQRLESEIRTGELPVLRAQNESMKGQLVELNKIAVEMPKVKNLEAQLAAAQADIKAEQAKRESLARDKVKLEQLLTDPNSPMGISRDRYKSLEQQNQQLQSELKTVSLQAQKAAVEAARARALEKEREELQKQLDRLLKDAGNQPKKSSKSTTEEKKKLAAAQARIAALEARPEAGSPQEPTLPKPQTVEVQTVISVPAPVSVPTQPKREFPASAAQIALEAQRAYNEQRYVEAETKYREILSLEKENVYTLANLAAAQMEQNKLSEAEMNLDKALKIQNDDAFSLSLQGLVKFRQEKYDDSLDLLSRASVADPKNAQTQNYLGLALSQKGLRIAAEAAFRKAVKLAPGYGVAHYNLAVFYATSKPISPELARWHYQKARSTGHPKSDELENLIAAR